MLTAYTPSTQENLQMRSLLFIDIINLFLNEKMNNNDSSYVQKSSTQKKCCHNQYFFFLPVVQGTTLRGQIRWL